MYADAGLHLTSRPVSPLRFLLREWTRGRVDECFACAVLALGSHYVHSSAQRGRTSFVGRKCSGRFETLSSIMSTAPCFFLSHLKLPCRHLALSLCVEDVRAQCDALTPETRERLQNVLSQKEGNLGTNVSLWRMLTAI